MTPRYIHEEIKELAHQMRFVPAAVRLTQLESAERLLDAIEPSKHYPYSFVVFKITDYRSRQRGEEPTLSGRSLVCDLCSLIEEVSLTLDQRPDQVAESVFTMDDLAARFSVATKTISRWRGRGLACRRLLFPDGKRRVVFLAGVLDRFVARNQEMVARGRRFSHLDDRERVSIIEQARQLASGGQTTMHEVATEIAKRTGRAIETIRYTIKRHDDEYPDRAVFGKAGQSAPTSNEVIFGCFARGDTLADLAKRFGTTRAGIYQVVMGQRLARLRERPIEFIYSPQFDLPGAEDAILGDGRCDIPTGPRNGRAQSKDESGGHLFDAGLLDRQQELELFRRFNYLKFRAEQLRSSLEEQRRPRHSLVRRIESLLDRACQVRNHLVQSNMRLVASIARKHVRDEGLFLEAVSDGGVALMRAVEKFDFGRGFKFSTYASWAIMRTFARTIPEAAYQRDRFQTGLDGLLESAPDHRSVESAGARPEAVRAAIDKLLGGLDAREQAVIRQHFGLAGTGSERTLVQISKGLKLSKERVRQIEARAIAKLRQGLTPQMIDQLFPLGEPDVSLSAT